MAGLLQLNVNKDNPFAMYGYEPEKSEVNADTDTVQGQLTKMVGKGSPFETMARTSAAEQSNAKGLLNSSLAVGEADKAAYSAMLPIAAADANTYNSNRMANTQASNQALQFSAGASNTGAQQLEQGKQQIRAIESQGGVQADLARQKADIDRQLLTADYAQRQILQQQKADIDSEILAQTGSQERSLQELRGQQTIDVERIRAENATALQALKGDQAERLAEIDGEYKNLIQTNALAGGVFNQLLQSITSIATNSTMSTESKQAAINQSTQWLRSALGTIGGVAGLNLASTLNF